MIQSYTRRSVWSGVTMNITTHMHGMDLYFHLAEKVKLKCLTYAKRMVSVNSLYELIHPFYSSQSTKHDQKCCISLSVSLQFHQRSQKTTCRISMFIMHISHSRRLPHLEFHLFELNTWMFQSAHSQLRVSHIGKCVSVVSGLLVAVKAVTLLSRRQFPELNVPRLLKFIVLNSVEMIHAIVWNYPVSCECDWNRKYPRLHIRLNLSIFCAWLIFRGCIFASENCLNLCSITMNWQFMSWNESINTTRMNAKNSSLNVNFFRLALSHTRFRWQTISIVVKPAMDVFIDFFFVSDKHPCGRSKKSKFAYQQHAYLQQ